MPTRKETTVKAYKKVAKATIATLEKRHDSQEKVEVAGTEEGGGARVLPDLESDVDPNWEPVDGSLTGADEDETVVLNTGTIQNKVPTKVCFGEAKDPEQQHLPLWWKKVLKKLFQRSKKTERILDLIQILAMTKLFFL
jgi:hypothetical protein